MAKILVVKSNAPSEPSIEAWLEQNHHTVDFVPPGQAGISHLCCKTSDLIIVDRNFSQLSIPEVCSAIRRLKHSVPILMLAVNGNANDVEQALDYGADDCITGSFEPRLFLAKVRALLRRFSTDDLIPKISAGDFTLYPDRLELYIRGAKKSVTVTECNILAALMKHPNQTVCASILSSEPGKLRAFIRKLRQKLSDVDHTLIKVDKGIGYRFCTVKPL